jgi:hypothetical protein
MAIAAAGETGIEIENELPLGEAAHSETRRSSRRQARRSYRATRQTCSAFGVWLRVSGLCLLGLCGAIHSAAAAGDGQPEPQLPWKLTLGDYRYGGYSGGDVNLRWQNRSTHAWLGMYGDEVFGSQARAGFDTAVQLGKLLQLQPSLQVATRGFAGGSLMLQAGDVWFGQVGIGRTDLRPYFNLNFDPNDAITLGVGYQASGGALYTLFVVADDRLHTRQRDWHLNVRMPFGADRATLDILRKSGSSDAGFITAWGFTATWDWPRWFLRLARDPYQNFSAQSAWRFSGGARF